MGSLIIYNCVLFINIFLWPFSSLVAKKHRHTKENVCNLSFILRAFFVESLLPSCRSNNCTAAFGRSYRAVATWPNEASWTTEAPFHKRGVAICLTNYCTGYRTMTKESRVGHLTIDGTFDQNSGPRAKLMHRNETCTATRTFHSVYIRTTSSSFIPVKFLVVWDRKVEIQTPNFSRQRRINLDSSIRRLCRC